MHKCIEASLQKTQHKILKLTSDMNDKGKKYSK